MPHTLLDIAYADFDDYMRSVLNSATRRKLRRKLKAPESGTPIELSAINNATSLVDEIYCERSKLHLLQS
jgi:hypothetical protein